jgi:hypothetical protein
LVFEEVKSANMNIDIIERIFFVIVIVVLIIALVKYKLSDYKKKRTIKKRFERGNLLESQARKFLKSKGYRILEEQKIYFHKYLVNGTPHRSKLILDYIVKKEDKTYIVEVKSGKSAIHLKDKNTRRQILEYDFVIENDGVFILDMENKNMQLVEFYSKAERKEETLRRVIIISAILGIIIPFWEFKILIGLIMFAIWRYPKKIKKVIRVLYNFK